MNSEHAIQAIQRPSTPQFKPLQRIEAPDKQKAELSRLRRVAGDFEALFLSQMMKSMQKTVASAKTGVDSGSDVLQGVGWERVAESMAQKGGMGLGEMLFEVLKGGIVGEVPDTVTGAAPDSLPDHAPKSQGKFIPMRKMGGAAP